MIRRLLVGVVTLSCCLVVGNAWAVVQYAMTDLGTLPGFGYGSAATCINTNGQVAGYSLDNNNGQHAFLYSGGTMTDLGTLGYSRSRANGINASGQIVGWACPNSNYPQPFLYSNETMAAVGSLPGYSYSTARGINTSGQIVGDAWQTSAGHGAPFLSSNGTTIDLGSLITHLVVQMRSMTAGRLQDTSRRATCSGGTPSSTAMGT